MRLTQLQVVEPKFITGLLKEENIGYLTETRPHLIQEVLEPLYDVHLGADNYVNVLNRLPVHYVPNEGEYEWVLAGQEEKNLALVKATSDAAGSSTVTATDKFGLGGSSFYLWFNEKYFNVGSLLHGPSIEGLKYLTKDEVVSGNLYGYKVEIAGGDEADYAPYQELQAGKKYAEMGAPVAREFSRKGNGIHMASNYKFRNVTTTMRKQFEMSGTLVSRTTGIESGMTPMFTVGLDENGKPTKQKYWIDAATWQFRKEIRRETAMQVLYGNSNKMADGTYMNRDTNGNVIPMFSGIYEQMNSGNYATYGNKISLDAFTDYIMQISVGKIRESKRKVMVTCGEWGAYELHKAIQAKAGSLAYTRTMDNLTIGATQSMYRESLFSKAVFINGIELEIVIDPFKDNVIHNAEMHPVNGTKASYDYDIFVLGDSELGQNLEMVRVKGQEDFYKCICGMRSPYEAANNWQNPGQVSTEVDGFKTMWMGIMSARVKNPLKTGRFVYSGNTVS